MPTVYAIIGDLGATNSRIASILNKGEDEYTNVEVFSSKSYSSPIEIIQEYCKKNDIDDFSILKLAVAAPIHKDQLTFANIDWIFSISELARNFPNSSVSVINDVEAQGQSLPFLKDDQIAQIGEGTLNPLFPRLTIALGSGIGTALTLFHHNEWIVIPSEGGHSSFTPETFDEIEWLSQTIANENRQPIIEHFVSGSIGIPRLIQYIHKKRSYPYKESSPSTLLHQLIIEKDPITVDIFKHYCAMIGIVARNFVLITGAKSLFLSGGIIPQFLPFFMASEFRNTFENSETMHDYLRSIPTYVITEPYPALVGLAHTL